jgi:hypothetical protein
MNKINKPEGLKINTELLDNIVERLTSDIKQAIAGKATLLAGRKAGAYVRLLILRKLIKRLILLKNYDC